LSSLGFENGIVKYVAGYRDDRVNLKKLVTTTFLFSILTSVLLALFLILFGNYFNRFIFQNEIKGNFIVIALAVLLTVSALQIFFVSTLNGLSQYKKVITLNIIGHVFGLLLLSLLIWKFNLQGALFSVIFLPVLLMPFSLYFTQKAMDFSFLISLKNLEFSILKNMLPYGLMALASGVLGPLVQIDIRNKIILEAGLTQAGYWDAINRISSQYLMLISTLLTVYYLPKLSIAETHRETQKVFLNYFKNIFPIFGLLLLILYIFRIYLIKILLSDEFLPVGDLFLWQIVGDLLKAASLILGYQFFAMRLTIAFITTEVFSLLLYYGLGKLLIPNYLACGAVMAHALTYFVYLLVLMVYFRKSIFIRK